LALGARMTATTRRTLLMLTEASDYLGRPTKTLQRWRHEGRGPRSAMVGGRVVYDQADLDAWVEVTRSARGGE
jgi:predicted DNA-binding transcriptional regulator AlpA